MILIGSFDEDAESLKRCIEFIKLGEFWKLAALYRFINRRYNRSTFALAQGVLLRNFRLEFTLGLVLKQLIFTRSLSSSHPYSSTKVSRIYCKVIPCNGLFGWFSNGFSSSLIFLA